MKQRFSDVWPIVHAARAQLVDDLRGVPIDAWTTPSLCPGWDVHDVLAHLVDSALTTRWTFVRRMVMARGDFDRDNQTGVDRHKSIDPHATLDAMRSAIEATKTPPANPATRLVEMFVHGEDIRRPLGIHSHLPVDAVVQALRYQAKTSVGIGGGRQRVKDLRLFATDTSFDHGPDGGLVVRGSAIDLLLAVSGRPVRPGALDGPGAQQLQNAS